MIRFFVVAVVLVSFISIFAQTGSRMKTNQALPAGYWPLEKSQPIIDKTQTIRLAPDLSKLSADERKAIAKLLEVGKIFQSIYEDQRHQQALSAYRSLQTEVFNYAKTTSPPLPKSLENLLTLYRLFQGPIATTLENKREPFLPVDPVVPGKNVYPWGVKKEEIESFLAAHPEKREEIMGLRTVVKTANSLNADSDLAKLRKYPALDTLHPGLRSELESISGGKPRGVERCRCELRVSMLCPIPLPTPMN